jgi:hypothetical protein
MFYLPRPNGRVDPTTRRRYYAALKTVLARLGARGPTPATRDLLRDYGHAAVERDRLIADLEAARAKDDRPAIRDAGRALYVARSAADRLESRLQELVARDAGTALRVDPLAALEARLSALRAASSDTGDPGEKRLAQSCQADGTHITQDDAEDNDGAA